jgi:hypothetical protein
MQHEMQELIKNATAKPVVSDSALDGVNKKHDEATKAKHDLDPAYHGDPTGSELDMVDPDEQSALDMAGNAYAIKNIEVAAIAAAVTWAGTDESKLDAGEGLGDRLFSLIIGIADEDKDGEISEEEAAVVQMAQNVIGDYLSSHGVADEDIKSLLANFDNDVAVTVQGQVTIPEDEAEHIAKAAFGEKAALDSVGEDEYKAALDSATADSCKAYVGEGVDEEQAFDAAFDDEYRKYLTQEALDSIALDDGAFDATYKKTKVVRGGKVKWVKKRIAGTVRLSGKQKAGIKKAGRKAHSAMAKMRRGKSMKISRARVQK